MYLLLIKKLIIEPYQWNQVVYLTIDQAKLAIIEQGWDYVILHLDQYYITIADRNGIKNEIINYSQMLIGN